MEQTKLEIDFKKILVTIALILVAVALILLFLHILTGGFGRGVPKVEIKVEQPLSLEERTEILRSRYVKRELTEEEKEKIEVLEKRYEEKQVKIDTTSPEYIAEQEALLERLRILEERN